jgi:hypothetical protein
VIILERNAYEALSPLYSRQNVRYFFLFEILQRPSLDILYALLNLHH